MDKVKHFVQIHETRETQMTSYLEQLGVKDRPAEGRFITGKFEFIDNSFRQMHQSADAQYQSIAGRFESVAASDLCIRRDIESLRSQM